MHSHRDFSWWNVANEFNLRSTFIEIGGDLGASIGNPVRWETLGTGGFTQLKRRRTHHTVTPSARTEMAR
jgi:hypothetical protein